MFTVHKNDRNSPLVLILHGLDSLLVSLYYIERACEVLRAYVSDRRSVRLDLAVFK
jgi:hypothetical protein